jgi:hypothetical protein
MILTCFRRCRGARLLRCIQPYHWPARRACESERVEGPPAGDARSQAAASHPSSITGWDFERYELYWIRVNDLFRSGKFSPPTPPYTERKQPRCAMTRQASTW